MSTLDPATILCDQIAREMGLHIRPYEMQRVLTTAGLTLTGGARQAVDTHLREVERLSRETFAG